MTRRGLKRGPPKLRVRPRAGAPIRLDPKSPATMQAIAEAVHNVLDGAHLSAFGHGNAGDGRVIAQGGLAGFLGYLADSNMSDDAIKVFMAQAVNGLLPQVRNALAHRPGSPSLTGKSADRIITDDPGAPTE